jgi:ATP-dependent DNA helicase RecG
MIIFALKFRKMKNLYINNDFTELLVHREYSIRYPARLTIYKETVVSENGNIPNTMGFITPKNVVPHPKNPTIADFFRQLGWVEDLGSGIRNMFNYCPIYVKDALPIMEESDVFKLTVRYEKEGAYTTNDSGKINLSLSIKHSDKILELIAVNPKITAIDIANNLSLSENHIRKILAQLTEGKIIERQGPRKSGEWHLLNHD